MSHQQKQFLKFHGLQSSILALGLAMPLVLIVIGILQKASKGSASAEILGTALQGNGPEAKALLIAVQPDGFEPAEMDVEEGRYLLVVQNRSGLSDIVVRLEAQDGKKVQEGHTQRQQWRKRFDLKKGTYRLTVENYPEWSCVLHVR